MRTFLAADGCSARLLTRVHAGGKKNPEHKRKKRGHKPPRKKEAKSQQPAPLPAVTAPPEVSTLKVLQASLPALDPWWSTFVGHSSGVWAGKCGAFNMADGSLEPMTLEGDNIEIKELHTRVVEGVCSLLKQAHLTWRAPGTHSLPCHNGHLLCASEGGSRTPAGRSHRLHELTAN